ncbi:hypothetical protein PR048_006849 [Dryococelus australis]|uniref:Uncharacterized protein n=1 Tax=Dryococelus australis TaxID=614101 RepID=A0ABQ9IC19_9NEOP|nr:hypothetical protein PR048_006849 [Dryococelus australis]
MALLKGVNCAWVIRLLSSAAVDTLHEPVPPRRVTALWNTLTSACFSGGKTCRLNNAYDSLPNQLAVVRHRCRMTFHFLEPPGSGETSLHDDHQIRRQESVGRSQSAGVNLSINPSHVERLWCMWNNCGAYEAIVENVEHVDHVLRFEACGADYGVCGSQRARRWSVKPASLATVGIRGIPIRGAESHEGISFQEEGRVRWVSDYSAGQRSRRQLQHPLIPPTPAERASKMASLGNNVLECRSSSRRLGNNLTSWRLATREPVQSANFFLSGTQLRTNCQSSSYFPLGTAAGDISARVIPGCTNIFPDPISNDPSSEPGLIWILVPIPALNRIVQQFSVSNLDPISDRVSNHDGAAGHQSRLYNLLRRAVPLRLSSYREQRIAESGWMTSESGQVARNVGVARFTKPRGDRSRNHHRLNCLHQPGWRRLDQPTICLTAGRGEPNTHVSPFSPPLIYPLLSLSFTPSPRVPISAARGEDIVLKPIEVRPTSLQMSHDVILTRQPLGSVTTAASCIVFSHYWHENAFRTRDISSLPPSPKSGTGNPVALSARENDYTRESKAWPRPRRGKGQTWEPGAVFTDLMALCSLYREEPLVCSLPRTEGALFSINKARVQYGVEPTSPGAVGWCATDVGCGRLFVRVLGKAGPSPAKLSSIKPGTLKKSLYTTIWDRTSSRSYTGSDARRHSNIQVADSVLRHTPPCFLQPHTTCWVMRVVWERLLSCCMIAMSMLSNNRKWVHRTSSSFRCAGSVPSTTMSRDCVAISLPRDNVSGTVNGVPHDGEESKADSALDAVPAGQPLSNSDEWFLLEPVRAMHALQAALSLRVWCEALLRHSRRCERTRAGISIRHCTKNTIFPLQLQEGMCERAHAGVPRQHCTITTVSYNYLLPRRWPSPRITRARPLGIEKISHLRDTSAYLAAKIFGRQALNIDLPNVSIRNHTVVDDLLARRTVSAAHLQLKNTMPSRSIHLLIIFFFRQSGTPSGKHRLLNYARGQCSTPRSLPSRTSSSSLPPLQAIADNRDAKIPSQRVRRRRAATESSPSQRIASLYCETIVIEEWGRSRIARPGIEPRVSRLGDEWITPVLPHTDATFPYTNERDKKENNFYIWQCLLFTHDVVQRHSTQKYETKVGFAAAVAERSDYSPPTQANWVRSPAGRLPDFRKWESCRTMPLVAGLSGGTPVPPAPHSGATPYSPQSPSSVLKTSLSRAAQMSSLTSCAKVGFQECYRPGTRHPSSCEGKRLGFLPGAAATPPILLKSTLRLEKEGVGNPCSPPSRHRHPRDGRRRGRGVQREVAITGGNLRAPRPPVSEEITCPATAVPASVRRRYRERNNTDVRQPLTQRAQATHASKMASPASKMLETPFANQRLPIGELVNPPRHFGATVSKRLVCSPPAKANRVESPARILRKW